MAGILISLGAAAFLLSDCDTEGAFLFSIGLTSVILLDAKLFTGKIGYVDSRKKLIESLIILGINLITALICGIIFYYIKGSRGINTPALYQSLWHNKLVKDWYEILFDGICCGICIYLSVEMYTKTKSIFVIVLGVLVFILSGFEHCIADIFYMGATMSFDLKSILYLLIIIVGNAIGSLLIRFLQLHFKLHWW